MELASRLSFFLWSSIPDAQLMDLAVKKELHRPEVLAAQVRRMLADPKAHALVENFAGQWLHLRELATVTPEVEGFDENLREAFIEETRELVDWVRTQDRPVTELLTADYTFLNERLAKHYGIPGVHGSPFPEGEAAAGISPPRLAGSGQHPHDHVDGESHVTGDPRQLDTRESAGRAGSSAAAGCGDQYRWRRHSGHHDLRAPAAGESSQESELRLVPQRDGSRRLRAGELQRDWRVARA